MNELINLIIKSKYACTRRQRVSHKRFFFHWKKWRKIYQAYLFSSAVILSSLIPFLILILFISYGFSFSSSLGVFVDQMGFFTSVSSDSKSARSSMLKVNSFSTGIGDMELSVCMHGSCRGTSDCSEIYNLLGTVMSY